jgi:hypothetical protein
MSPPRLPADTPQTGCEHGRATRQHVDEVLDPAVADHGTRLRDLERLVWKLAVIIGLFCALGSIVGGAVASQLFQGPAPAAAAVVRADVPDAPAPLVRVSILDAGGAP